MLYIDLDADLSMEDDNGRNLAVLAPGVARPAVGQALVAGRPKFWSWAIIDNVEEQPTGKAIVTFRQVSAKDAARVGPLVVDVAVA
jgi:hypothetical protein